MTPLPEPLTPPDCDLRNFPYMPLDVVRLLDSDTFALLSGEAFKVAIALWCKAWHQVPAGSLPDDDRVLARLTGLTLDAWRSHREEALSSFVKCADGRFYHPVVCEKARESWDKKQAQRARTDAARAAKGGTRPKAAAAPPGMSQSNSSPVTDDDTPLSQAQNGSKGTEQKGKEEDSSLRSESSSSSSFAKARDFGRRRWFDALVAAAGPGLADPNKRPALHTGAAELDLWANAGVDLELDAIPTVAALTAKARGDPVASWSYFRPAVLKAHATRTADITQDLDTAKKAAAHGHDASRPTTRTGDNQRALDRALDDILKADELAAGTTPAP